MADNILHDRRDGIATITINRPERRNAVGYEGWLELRRTVEGIAEDDSVRVVVITGAGDEAFSAGADIRDFDRSRADSTQARVYQAAFAGAMDAIEALPVPTVCLIKGFCVGGGCELTLAADLRIAADNGRFGIPAARLGIVIGYGEMDRLTRLVGPGNASYILLSGRIIDAGEALRIGLVNEVVPLGEIDGRVQELAGEMARLAPLSQRQHKRIMRRVLRDPSLETLTPEEEGLPFANFDSEDFREGRGAFAERRQPEFKGR